MKNRKFYLFVIAILAIAFSAGAQQWQHCGPNTFDGEHRNEAGGFLVLGGNSVTNFFMGPELTYRRFINNRWYVGGATEMQFGKQKFGIYGQGAYVLPAGKFNFHFRGKMMYNRYHKFRTNEWSYNLSAVWEAKHFDMTLGVSYVNFRLLESSHWERPSLQFGFGAHIRPRTNSWNIGIFARNYDEFYYEHWNINWGFNYYASLAKNLKMYGEFTVRPAGSTSQLATHYEFSFKTGVKYVW